MTTEQRAEQPDQQMVPLYFTEFVQENARQHAVALERIAATNERITAVEERIGSTNERINSTNARIDSTNDRIDSLQRSLDFTNRLLLAMLGVMGAMWASTVGGFVALIVTS